MRRKTTITALILLFFLLFWVIYSLFQPSVLVGTSKNGEWNVTYTPSENVHFAEEGLWDGYYQWKKDERPTVNDLKWMENNKTLVECKSTGEPIVLFTKKVRDRIEGIPTMSLPPEEQVRYSTKISWREDEKQHSEVIVLKKHKRLFVTPLFIRKIVDRINAN
ncbi:hypothetical protein A374_07136 [Fictibacillus macauensis ZFHKF-1]|uniref:Uncharacterized protein n=1 Tax=Fictibacillus macauensis ZFHKF-1 TaxID=1196324 RepID=I8UGQ4_9BACL|nr:hypothetical protein [Fictibacillus macauensis]EIT86075.1 hypothetical protein A374_07136 [Fictibacillus macauensis ZFHKF-1]